MRVQQSYPQLFTPIEVGSIWLKNRVVMAPMVTQLATESGGITQKMLDYYEERAKGGVAMTMTAGSAAVAKDSPPCSTTCSSTRTRWCRG